MAKATKKKKAVKKLAPKKASKKAVPKPITTDSNGDPIGGVVLQTPEKASKSPKGTEIDTSKGAVSIKSKKTAAEAKTSEEKKKYSVVMRGGVPTKVEDDGDDI